MTMRSPSFHPSAAAEFLSRGPVSLAAVVEAVGGPGHGAVVAFAGRVRDTEAGRRIAAIDYEAYEPMAERVLGRILDEARGRWGVRAALLHRVGRVPAGEASVVLACSAPHRREAFEAAEFVLERLKRDVPIWKAGFP